MPTAPKTFRLIPKAQQEKQWASRREPRRVVYASRAWKSLRRQIIQRDCGLCQECSRQGITKAAGKYAQVHHIRPAVTDDDVLCDESNLETLCPACHSAITATEDGAFGK